MNIRTMARALALGLLAGASLLAPGAAVAADAKPTRPSVEAFARMPQVQNVSLSPDGLRYAALVDIGEETALVIRTLDGSQPPVLPYKADNRSARFRWVRWASNERLVASVALPSQRDWTGSIETRLISVHRSGKSNIELVQRRRVGSSGMVAQLQDQVVDWLPEDGRHILVALDEHRVAEPAVFRINLDNGERERVHAAAQGVRQWITDQNHRVRVGIGQVDGVVEVRACDPDGQNWRTLWKFDLLADTAVHPLGFGPDPQQLYVVADFEGRQSVQLADLGTPGLPRKVLLSHQVFDVGGSLVTLPGSGEVAGIRSSGIGNTAASYWNDEARALARGIDQALPARRNTLLQFSADGKRVLLYSEGNAVPGQYYVAMRDRGSLALLADTYPELEGAVLPKKSRLVLQARDGRKLPSLLTLPVGVEPRALPAVLLPHGGPTSNDTLDFDPWVQFLASRGYAVLQVDFRGSSGWGREHMKAGLKRWGLEMQDDLNDALQAVIERGTIDKSRVCVVGGSYGGYAALMGGAKTPRQFRCVVSINGVTDLPAMAAHRQDFVEGRAGFERAVGSIWKDAEQLEQTSPSRRAAQFEAPVLLVHGSHDRTVPLEQSELMDKALRRAGKPVELITLEGGDHGVSHGPHRLQVFKALEAFLARHLAPPAAQ
ncbi:MAG: S9 family peptidase [Burkholderiales bacterium]|nr:S9 family peptidase [Burkholderiales bacterium]